MTKELLHKFNVGDPLTDNECKDLYMFFDDLVESLMLLGPTYYLAWGDLLYKRRTVRGYMDARGLK